MGCCKLCVSLMGGRKRVSVPRMRRKSTVDSTGWMARLWPRRCKNHRPSQRFLGGRRFRSLLHLATDARPCVLRCFCFVETLAPASTAQMRRGGGPAAASHGGGGGGAPALCRDYQQGYCRFGDGCRFVHDNSSGPRSAPRGGTSGSQAPPSGSGQVCRDWSQHGSCRFGDGCRFVHEPSGGGRGGGGGGHGSHAAQQHPHGGGGRGPSPARAGAAPTQICKNWSEHGNCSFGASCRFSHDSGGGRSGGGGGGGGRSRSPAAGHAASGGRHAQQAPPHGGGWAGGGGGGAGAGFGRQTHAAPALPAGFGAPIGRSVFAPAGPAAAAAPPGFFGPAAAAPAAFAYASPAAAGPRSVFARPTPPPGAAVTPGMFASPAPHFGGPAGSVFSGPRQHAYGGMDAGGGGMMEDGAGGGGHGEGTPQWNRLHAGAPAPLPVAGAGWAQALRPSTAPVSHAPPGFGGPAAAGGGRSVFSRPVDAAAHGRGAGAGGFPGSAGAAGGWKPQRHGGGGDLYDDLGTAADTAAAAVGAPARAGATATAPTVAGLGAAAPAAAPAAADHRHGLSEDHFRVYNERRRSFDLGKIPDVPPPEALCR